MGRLIPIGAQKRDVPALLNAYATELIRELYHGFKVILTERVVLVIRMTSIGWKRSQNHPPSMRRVT